jgi:hypothetical protein
MATNNATVLKFCQFAEPDYEERELGYIYAWSGADYDGIELKLFAQNTLFKTDTGGVKVGHRYFIEIFDRKETAIKTLPYSEIEGAARTVIIDQALARPTCPVTALLDRDSRFREEALLQIPRLHSVAQDMALKLQLVTPLAAVINASPVKRI